jgi:hypothetical protein
VLCVPSENVQRQITGEDDLPADSVELSRIRTTNLGRGFHGVIHLTV